MKTIQDVVAAARDTNHYVSDLTGDFRIEEFIGDLEQSIKDRFGTVCPQCGLRQGHHHLGWLDLGEFKEDDGALFTFLQCDDPEKGCGYQSLIVRFQPEYKGGKKGEIQDAVWNLFGGFPGKTVCPGGVG